MRRAFLLGLVLVAAVPACSDDAKLLAESRTCDAVRRLDRLESPQPELEPAVYRKAEDQIVTTAKSERPSDFAVTIAQRYELAVRETRLLHADAPMEELAERSEAVPDAIPEQYEWALRTEYQNVRIAIRAACGLEPGGVAYDTIVKPPPR